MSCITLASLQDKTQTLEAIAKNIKHLDTFAVSTLEEIVKAEEWFGSTSLEVFAHVDLGLIFNKDKGRYEWMVNEVERIPNASLWNLDKHHIEGGSDVAKEIAKNLSDYLLSSLTPYSRQRLYSSQTYHWWEAPNIH